ncbi:MAG: hypothetical protein BroJett004_10200 [Planctomycetota bacterium]|nr:HDOD domain-containing protein [Phycisphaerales bacterium]MDL1905645.1 HDOD domain-containing protein [Synechococcales cyanobacterium CNB]GIK18856.1 MAG: hypothetical protein BroJett004_10200 [Planctomycetota bacterium]
MNQQLLEQVLACPTLPTLPTVAVRILQLTADADVSLEEVADVIEKDQGLSAKVLRTVNSPLYGLRQRCGSISRAIVLMGLGPVKSLAIGFSLVSAVDDDSDPRFDYVSYWRRGLVTAAAARIVAHDVGLKQADEAFLGGLLQDVGMVALYRTLGADYLRVLDAAGGDHRQLVKHELAALDTQHPDIGAMLAQRWRLPDELVLPIKYHERPTAAPMGCCELVRCVALGNLFHDTITDADAVPALRRLYQRARDWFRLEPSGVDALLHKVTESAVELGRLLRLQTGEIPTAESIITEAHARLAELSSACGPDDADTRTLAHRIDSDQDFDPLTGVQCATVFERSLRLAFEHAVRNPGPLSLIRFAIGGLGALAQTEGQVAADEAILNAAAVLRREFSHLGGTIARLDPNGFAVLLPDTPRIAALRGAESVASLLSRGDQARTRSPLTLAIGVATLDERTARTIGSPRQFLLAAATEMERARSNSDSSSSPGVVAKAA